VQPSAAETPNKLALRNNSRREIVTVSNYQSRAHLRSADHVTGGSQGGDSVRPVDRAKP